MSSHATFGSERTPANFLRDVGAAAKAAGVLADPKAIAFAFAPFADLFCSCPVELRTTSVSEAERDVSFRFVDERARGNVWSTARDWFGLTGAPRDFMDAVQRTFELAAEGIDADVRTGFRKAWAFLAAGHPAERFAQLASAPSALKAAGDILARHGLTHFSIVGTDHHNATCNLYPMLQPGWATPQSVQELAASLDLAPMDETWLQWIERSVAANVTFSWSTGQVERLSFYRPAMSLEEVPDDPALRRFATECPALPPQRVCIPSIAYARKGHYRKVEVDYDGGIVGVLVRCTQVPIAD